jgi:hypothetical protein
MKKYIGLFLLSFLLITGCDDSSSSNSVNSESGGSLQETPCVVQGTTEVPLQEGDIGFYDCGNYRVVVTTKTKLLHSRESCSGLSTVDFGYVEVGDTLFVGYKTDDADYSSKPTILRATYIEGYKPDCINGTNTNLTQSVTSDCDKCPDPFFD